MRHVRLRRWLVWAALILVALLALSASFELVLERRDATRLTANDQFYAVAGRRVRFRLTGSRNPGPTVVLVPGGMASLEEWDGIQNALSADAPVLSYDRGGMGFSEEAAGHDAAAESDELAALLDDPEITPPFVIVSYSLSSLVARALAARHADLVAGLAFIDPVVPEATAAMPPSLRATFQRKFGYGVAKNALEALLGYARCRQLWRDRREAPKTELVAKENTILASFHHWWATTEDIWALDRSAAQVMAMPDARAVPVIVLSAIDPSESERLRVVFEAQQDLAKRSPHGEFRSIAGMDHLRLLSGSAESRPVIDMVLDVERRARSVTSASAP